MDIDGRKTAEVALGQSEAYLPEERKAFDEDLCFRGL
jgi:hypothetical protein